MEGYFSSSCRLIMFYRSWQGLLFFLPKGLFFSYFCVYVWIFFSLWVLIIRGLFCFWHFSLCLVSLWFFGKYYVVCFFPILNLEVFFSYLVTFTCLYLQRLPYDKPPECQGQTYQWGLHCTGSCSHLPPHPHCSQRFCLVFDFSAEIALPRARRERGRACPFRVPLRAATQLLPGITGVRRAAPQLPTESLGGVFA